MISICRSLFVLFRLSIMLSVLGYTDSDYPFGIFKLFLYCFQRCSEWISLDAILQTLSTLTFNASVSLNL